MRQLVLDAVALMPASFERRLRALVAPSSLRRSEVVLTPDPRSPDEKLLLRDLRYRSLRRQRPDTEGKTRLAYFSPLPPEKSGVSFYSEMLLPALARHYEIDVIVNQQPEPGDTDGYRVRSYAWFREHAGAFDRILYHVGNAEFHAHMFEAMETWPGVVVLHDFFLGHVVRHMDYQSPGYLASCLYAGSGYTELAPNVNDLHSEALIWAQPFNARVMRYALAVIAHSPYSRTLAAQYYGDDCRQAWHIIPHLREPAAPPERSSARLSLAIPTDAFVVCSFGHSTPTKLHDRILESWQASALREDDECWLIFVGELSGGAHGGLIRRLVRQSRNPRIRITGWTDSATFEQYLAAADVAVQLRSRSRGETSGAVIDCLNHGLATIVNAHGTMQDLPAEAVVRLADDFRNEELVAALEQLRGNDDLRRELGDTARAVIRRDHAPDTCAELYREAIEDSYREAEARWASLPDSSAAEDPESSACRDLLAGLAPQYPVPLKQKQLLVDVSAIVHNDLRTGVERVVRAQLLELIATPPAGYRVEPIYLQAWPEGWRYQYARGYGYFLLGVPGEPDPDEKVDFATGDILYMPDLNAHHVERAHEDGLFEGIRSRGVSVHTLIHDVMPITHPAFFPPGAGERHEAWLLAISSFSDQVICISEAVRRQYEDWLDRAQNQVQRHPPVVVNYHGADMEASRPSQGSSQRAEQMIQRLGKLPTLLMVGTIEPRKAHAEVLDACENLWRSGHDFNLVIVGSEGWKGLPESDRRNIPETVRRLDEHPQRSRKLFWPAEVTDEFLAQLYEHCDCLLAASHDEGFGLPIIEAARHGMDIIARDIPVFREVAREGALYFDEVQTLDAVLSEWLTRRDRASVAVGTIPARSWKENVSRLKRLLVEQR